jgi:hypothetical protein
MIYELWRSPDDTEQAFFAVDENYEANRNLNPPDSILVWTVAAESYNEAMSLYYEYMDWGPYKPV